MTPVGDLNRLVSARGVQNGWMKLRIVMVVEGRREDERVTRVRLGVGSIGNAVIDHGF